MLMNHIVVSSFAGVCYMLMDRGSVDDNMQFSPDIEKGALQTSKLE